jgi:hypothetical protein
MRANVAKVMMNKTGMEDNNRRKIYVYRMVIPVLACYVIIDP